MKQVLSRWVVTPPSEPALVQPLAELLDIPETLAALLVQRGYASPDEAKNFLRPRLDNLADPYRLRGMPRAVELIAAAVRGGRTIVIHGDYDVDGQCATTLLTRVLRAGGAEVVPFVPHRLRDGYDFGPAGLAQAKTHDASLIITCDCGTTATESVTAAQAEGRRVVVTDHHLPGAVAPADAMVNPQHPECTSSLNELCGAGVAFKLAQALVAELGLPENLPYHLLDLVALATVADVVPLTGENRTLVRFGLKTMASSRWPGIRALVEVVGLAGKPIRAGHVGYILAPKLNAAGRIGDAMDGVRLLLCDDPSEARTLARKLDTINARRQDMDEAMLDEAVEVIEETVDLEKHYGLVLAQEGWHPGVIGLVASRIVERYTRPTILVALEGDEGRGSGRSIPRFDLHAGLSACAEHLTRFGGHRMAAGLSLRRERLEAFSTAFNEAVRSTLTADDLIPTRRIDVVIPVQHLDDRLERLFRHLEPCGPGNPAPVLAVGRANARGHRVVGSNHLRFTLTDGTGSVAAIAFDWADRVDGDWWRRPVDVALKLERNEWMGTSTLQARVVEIRPSQGSNLQLAVRNS
ncbi:MAG: single-stranded-DNA-specific exonuclease RecJ [Gemmatimonadales bacterium]|nr:single-stranded-DNA-specific exonuclease RecJ [Gemmatimonadales bacterium]NIN12206.1 single-stranded-DNA-specific exonuclease RecJ [Gemmatimonadales bacterium]NIN50621.1 single-stranded-DNA-specific exonuclease RecJ [Gemmatimonadales bacterium]NIP08085.1 single-stranded-DNA-specific exonuclease RecJ [Gemmatimonadales bacterium]NIR03375.1 single-stranded-DNA-specific exonuclease RecJ [Gemmatimonadales bacterium]